MFVFDLLNVSMLHGVCSTRRENELPKLMPLCVSITHLYLYYYIYTHDLKIISNCHYTLQTGAVLVLSCFGWGIEVMMSQFAQFIRAHKQYNVIIKDIRLYLMMTMPSNNRDMLDCPATGSEHLSSPRPQHPVTHSDPAPFTCQV